MKKLIQLPTSPWDINPDTLIFTDLHLHERKEFNITDPVSGLNSRLVEGLNILDQIIDITLSNRGREIGNIKFLGDIFELKDRVPNHILIEFQKRLNEIRTINFTAMLGNHDYNLLKYPTLSLFTNRICFITEPCIQIEGKLKIAYLPFQRDTKDFWHYWTKLHNKNPDLFSFHQELPGAEYESGKKIPGEVPPSIFDPKIIYISGHLHKYQKLGPVTYLGAPYQIKFTDEGCKKYVMLFNSVTKKMALLELHYPKFLSFNIENFNIDLSVAHDNYIRIIGEVEPQNWTPEIKKAMREEVEKLGAKAVTFQVMVKKTHQVSIPKNKIDDDDAIISLYVEENNQTLDKERLLQIGLEIFHSN
jgi:hypothetical protein